MASSRRDFLKKGTLVALTAGVPAVLRGNVNAEQNIPAAPAGFGLTKSAFTSQLNTKFRVNANNSKVTLTLVDVVDLSGKKVTKPGREAFSLQFRGDRESTFRQSTYLIEHDHLGLFSFLLVPIGSRDKTAQYYEAVINRLHP